MNQFRLRRLIGRGGMGEVYEAEAMIPGSRSKPVALKVMRSRLRGQERYTALFHREARTNLDISHEHPGLVTVFGHFEDNNGQLYIVMDLVRGCSLHTLLKTYQRLPLDLIIYIAAQMLDAIDHMHQLGYLHLDLSPSNVLLAADGRVKISDLGLAKLVPSDGAPSSHIAKPPYASPEVLRSGTVDTRSDMYSFAAVVYQMATGEPPFGRQHDIQHVMARLDDWRPPPLDGLPAELRALIGDMFHDDPAARSPQSARVAREMLPAAHAMQATREQLASVVEPLYQRAYRDSRRHRIPQLCFDVPFIVKRGSVDLLDGALASDTDVDTDVQGVRDVLDGRFEEGSTDIADEIAGASLDVSGLDWASESTSASAAAFPTDPTLPGRRTDTGTASPNSPAISGSLRTQEVLMDEAHRFLEKLSDVVGDLPVLRTDGFNAEPHVLLLTLEADVSELGVRYEALSAADKAKTELVWIELGTMIDNANTVHFTSREIFDRFAADLGFEYEDFDDLPTEPIPRQLALVRNTPHDGTDMSDGVVVQQVRQTRDDRGRVELAPPLPTLPYGPAFVGPVPVPEDIKPGGNKRRLAAIGGTLAAMAALALAMLMPEPQPVPTKPLTVTAPIQKLPLSANDFPTCEPTEHPAQNRPAAAMVTPKRRKTSKTQFVKDTDSVVIRRKNKPTLKVTVTEVADESPSKPERVHVLDVGNSQGMGFAIPVDESLQITLEIPE